jgi:hypothetical protein
MRSLVSAALILLLTGGAAAAQAPQVAAVWPPGGMRGGKVEARVDGANLAGATAVHVSGAGVKAALGAPAPDGKTAPLTLEVASDAGPGPYEVRVQTGKGVSNPAYLWVTATPEAAETEPNNQPEQATKLAALPVTVYGRMDAAEDVDWFEFQAAAGETLVFDIAASRLYSALDAALDLRDSAGRILGTAMEGYDRDPRILHTFKQAGTYRVQVRDALFRGGGTYIYKLTLGKLPAVIALTPSGARPGETLNALGVGANLGAGGQVSLQIPAGAPEGAAWAFPMVNGVAGVPVQVAVGGDAQAPHAAAGSEHKLGDRTLTVYGAIAAPKQKDQIKFAAEQGKPVQIMVRARSVGSRLMPFARVLDSAGKELLHTEDQIGRDPRVTFAPPATGTYTLEVSGVSNLVGPDYHYRAVFLPPGAADFRVAATPDLVSLGKGQTFAVTVNVDRLAGFGAPVTVRLEGAPAGVAVSPLTVQPGQTSGIITLTAPPDQVGLVGMLRAVAESTGPDGQKREIAVTPVGNLPRPGEGRVVPRPVAFMAVATTDAVPLFTLAPAQTAIALTQGQSITVKVTAGRKAGDAAAQAAIALALANLPPGVTAETPAVPEKQGEATIKLTAAADARPGVYSAHLTGKLGENTQSAPALIITVAPK